MLEIWIRGCVWCVIFGYAQAASFRFAIVGDRTGRAVPGVYERVWKDVASARPAFVVTVGDAIEGLNDERAQSEWTAVKRAWPAEIPIYHTPGNHDIWNNFSEALFTRETGSKPFYSFDFQEAHFIVLDNSRTEDLSQSQLKFASSELARYHSAGRPSRPVFLLFHRPYWLIPLKLRVNGFVLQKLARDSGVCCVISGHGHQLQTVERDGVLYLEVGSSGASLAGAGAAGIGYDDGWFYQYVIATVSGQSVEFEIRELGTPFGKGRVRRIKAEAAAALDNNRSDRNRD